jgi:hypothetical protein
MYGKFIKHMIACMTWQDIQAYLRYCVTPSIYGLYPSIHRWESVSRPVGPRWHRRLRKSVDQWQCVIFRSEVESHQRARCQRQTIADWLPAFVYFKKPACKQHFWLAACTWGSSHWFVGDVSGGILERSLRVFGVRQECNWEMSQHDN